MRSFIFMLGLGCSLAGCGKSGEEAGREAARKQAEEEAKQKPTGTTAAKVTPPVAGGAKLTCAQVIDPAVFQQAIGEAEPLTVKSSALTEAAAVCSLVRGGKRPSTAEQTASLKKNARLGVLAGDEICTITLYCYTIEDPDKFRARCKEKKHVDDESLGFYSCVEVFAEGTADKKHFQFFDSDTKCIFDVRGGPSNVDNDLIGKCAKAAHDLIGPDQIKPGGAPVKPAEPEGSAAGSGA
jgi:hypothetical protein